MKSDTQALQKFMADMPSDPDELARVQEKHRQILHENLENERNRKKRNHRLCEHGAIMEEYFPQTMEMDKQQFAAFMQQLAASQ